MIGGLLATYVHDLSPILVELGPLKLRWYGLSYVAGFLAAYLILQRLARRDLWIVPEEKVSDVVTYSAMFGVFLGGRIGYVLLYLLPKEGIGLLFRDPLVIIRVWDGGMASHGGIMGIFFFLLWYARRHQLSWPGLGDGICVVAPLGIFFGRMANFVNGELYGTKTDSSLGVIFPDVLREPGNRDALDAVVYSAAMVDDRIGELMAQPEANTWSIFPRVVEAARSNEALQDIFRAHVEPRHASQLYEGILEGLVLFVILFLVRIKFPRLGYGILTGLFFVIYALFRISVEAFREPDAALVLGITKGQFYSIFMILIGAAFLRYGLKRNPEGSLPGA